MELATQTWQGADLEEPKISADASPAPVAAVILAAGKGTRMKSDLHKVLPHELVVRDSTRAR